MRNTSGERSSVCGGCVFSPACRLAGGQRPAAGQEKKILQAIFLLFFLPAVLFVLSLAVLRFRQPLFSLGISLGILLFYYFVLRPFFNRRRYGA